MYKAFESNKNSTEISKICGNWFKFGGAYRNRTDESEFCRLVPYRLAKAPNIGAGNGAQTRDLCLGKANMLVPAKFR